jgi:hypothetical protein
MFEDSFSLLKVRQGVTPSLSLTGAFVNDYLVCWLPTVQHLLGNKPEKSLDSPRLSARIPPNPVIVKEFLTWDEIAN